jgi:predicted glycosyl hydrolase (DUF1957 family)
MSLYFYRPAFKSGVMYVEDQEPETGKKVKVKMTPSMSGTEVTFHDDAYVKAKYPAWFTDKTTFEAKKAERTKAKKEKRVPQKTLRA